MCELKSAIGRWCAVCFVCVVCDRAKETNDDVACVHVANRERERGIETETKTETE